MIHNSWWAEKYRPTTIEDFIGNDQLVEYIKKCIETQDIPHLLFYNEKSGSGKTSLSKIIAKSLDADVLYINASNENNIDTVRDKILGFASSIGFGKWKIIILDEFSYFTVNAQSALNNIMETYSSHTRFILTCNYVDKVLPSIKSRCTCINLHSPDKKIVAKRLKYILDQEQIQYKIEDVAKLVFQHYPDQRTIINEAQRFSFSGTLTLTDDSLTVSDYCPKIVDILKTYSDPKTAFVQIRQIIADSKVRHFDDLFRYLFDNLDEFAGQGKQAQTILHLADAQYKINFVIDKEIIVAAMFINLLKDLR